MQIPHDFTDDNSTLIQGWIGVFKQQAMICANGDQVLCRYIVSLSHNELIISNQMSPRELYGRYIS